MTITATTYPTLPSFLSSMRGILYTVIQDLHLAGTSVTCSMEDCMQKESDALLPELVQRVYQVGRYAMLCCAGHSAPRLCGLWTGEWNPAWSGAYTMDANVNIEVSGMNLGNLPEAAAGYCRFVMKQLPDWRENARMVYDMQDALLVPVNTDGHRAMMVEYDVHFPFQHWNAGASWMASPIFEMWQCFGEQTLLIDGRACSLAEDVLRPLLRQTLSFWLQFCDPAYYTDASGKPCHAPGKTRLAEGEHYLLNPTYSPENRPLGCKSALTLNATMDVFAAQDCLRMMRLLETACPSPDSGQIIAACEQLSRELPPWLTDDTGALKEWALDAYAENNAHRHVSHLHCAWPAFATHGDEKLRQACIQAIANRDRENSGKDDTSSHGWIHRALILARLGMGAEVTDVLHRLFASDVFYATGMTDHDTDRCRSVFCTDTLLGLQGIIQEMLVYSDDHSLKLLPAAPAWRKGSLAGMNTRCGLHIEQMDWDLDAGQIELTAQAQRDVEVTVGGPAGWHLAQPCDLQAVQKGTRVRLLLCRDGQAL